MSEVLLAPPPAAAPIVAYPGHIVKRGEPDADVVRALQRRLNALGFGPLAIDGDFGPATADELRSFQARTTDQDGLPLKIDGQAGPLTWWALFGKQSVPRETGGTVARPLMRRVVTVAEGEEGVREEPPFSNTGPRVNQYITRTGLQPGVFWCMCFVYWCFDEAAAALGVPNPCVRTAGVLDHWNRAAKRPGVRRITAAEAVQNPALVRPGQVFCIRTQRKGSPHAGHTGIVVSVQGGKLVTMEGNSNAAGSDNGGSVCRIKSRTISSINLGFVDYNC